MHAYNSLYRSMFWKHRLCTEKPVTLSEPCIQPITQVWTMHTAHYTGICSENTGYVLRNQSHCLNHAYIQLHRSKPCIHLIIKDYVLKTQAWYWETSHTVLTINTAHYTGIWSQITGLVLRNQSHCLNHAYSPLHRSEPCIQLIIKDYVLKT